MSISRVTIQNRTGRPLVPYLMVQTGSVAHLQAQHALTVPAGGSYEADPYGGDLVFFDPHKRDGIPQHGVRVELVLGGEVFQLASTVYAYTVPPDQAYSEPEHAPCEEWRTERSLDPDTTTVTISLGSDFAVSVDEHGAALSVPS